jgi:hypothetical protein
MNHRNWIPWIGAALALTAALLLLAPTPTLADWLVTHDGARIEIQGSWQEKRRVIVFTALDGTLASIRASEIDLEASRILTEEKAAAGQEPAAAAVAKEKKAAVLVLTDDDVNHVDPTAFEAGATGEEGEEGGAPPDLEVTNWRQSDLDEGGVRIRGTLRNNGKKTAVGLTMDVNLLDVQGVVVATRPGVLTSRALQPSEMANFQVDFPEVILFNSASFSVEQVEVQIGPADNAQAPLETEVPTEDG